MKLEIGNLALLANQGNMVLALPHRNCKEGEGGVLGILALLPNDALGPLPHLPYDALVGPIILQLKSWLASVTLARWTGTMLKQIEAALRHFPLEFVFS